MKSLRGFTLIELLVVIAVLGVLATGLIVLINPLGQMEKARDAGRKSDLKQITNALEEYYIDNLTYPNYQDWSFSQVTCSMQPWAWGGCGASPDLRDDLSPRYLKTIPIDPINRDYGSVSNRGYQYEPIGGTGFRIYTHLENTQDPQINCPAGCGYQLFANYYVGTSL